MQKKLTLLAACCLLPGLAWSADKLETQKQRFSYALGYQMGMQITQGKAGELDADALTAAIRDVTVVPWNEVHDDDDSRLWATFVLPENLATARVKGTVVLEDLAGHVTETPIDLVP